MKKASIVYRAGFNSDRVWVDDYDVHPCCHIEFSPTRMHALRELEQRTMRELEIGARHLAQVSERLDHIREAIAKESA